MFANLPYIEWGQIQQKMIVHEINNLVHQINCVCLCPRPFYLKCTFKLFLSIKKFRLLEIVRCALEFHSAIRDICFLASILF